MRGFTLIELVVVMVLIGVTMAFALPRLSNFVFSDPLKQTTRKLTLLITQTSRLAVRTSRPYFLEYDSQTRRFKVLPVEKKEEVLATIKNYPKFLSAKKKLKRTKTVLILKT